MSNADVGRRIHDAIAPTLDEETYAAMFSPDGLARQCQWVCEDGWIVAYTTTRIRHGRLDGKFAVMVYKPVGRGARSGNAEEWVRVKTRTFARRKTARAHAEGIYAKHSPKWAGRA